jgi:ABC-2 type transport system ATP-binding protein
MVSPSPAIETHALTKHFGSFTALDGLSISVELGEIYGFLGPNGAGKTTTIRMLLALARPSLGEAHIFGLDAWADAAEIHKRLAFVPGEFNAWPQLRGAEILDLLGSVHGGYDAHRRDELCERFEFDPGMKAREYSKGNRQKMALIAALMVDADLLILDEPTSGLDPLMEITFRHCAAEARDRGSTVFLSSHILSEVEAVCDRVAILRLGKLIDVGTLDQLRKLQARDVTVIFEHEPVPDLSGVPGVEHVEVDGPRMTFHLRGDPNAILHALTAHRLVSVDIHEPSLEELFLAYYGDDVDRVDSTVPSLS